MKNSFYNIFYRHAGCFYVYNQVSSALIKVDEELWRNLPLNKLEGTDDDTISQLKKMGIVCEKSLEESDVIVAKNKYNRYSNNTIRMTIMPTMSCNFRCWWVNFINRLHDGFTIYIFILDRRLVLNIFFDRWLDNLFGSRLF